MLDRYLERSPVSADALQGEWLHNLSRLESLHAQRLVERLHRELSAPVPDVFHELLALQSYQIFKRRRLGSYYCSLYLFVWKRALEMAQPLYAYRLVGLWRRHALHDPGIGGRVERIDRHLALFSLLTDDFVQQGFLGVAHHVVSRVLGDVQKEPRHLFAVVRLADHLDHRFENLVSQFSHMEIVL